VKQTKKYLAALKAVAVAGLPPQGDSTYATLEKEGYQWKADKGEWVKFTPSANAPKTGIVDIRIRASMVEIEIISERIESELKKAGFTVVRCSAPDPDDRHGTPVTACVYMQFILPKGKSR